MTPTTVFSLPEKFACITLDFETDYGDRIGGEFNILKSSQRELEALAQLYSALEVPVSAFIRTDILINHPKSLDVLKLLAKDYHCHSHTHNTRHFDSQFEIATTAAVFEEFLGHKPLGYRAPQGVLHEGDIDLLKAHGFKFSASVFPSYRPGKFNHLQMPLNPFLHENGLVEFPFAALPQLRYTISLSYLKLLSFNVNRFLYSRFGLPNILVFDSHLHDYIVNPESFGKLPPKLKAAWGINKNAGISYFKRFVQLLKEQNYQFITMTALYQYLEKHYLPHENRHCHSERTPVSGHISG